MSTPPIPGTSAYHGAAMQAGGRRPTLVAVAFIAVFASTASCRQILGISDPPRPCSDPLMIDDLEDGDVSICNSGGRQGGWFNFGDGSPAGDLSPGDPFTPTAIPDSQRGASRWAARFHGSGLIAPFQSASNGSVQSHHHASTPCRNQPSFACFQ